MSRLPDSNLALVVRTDFSDDAGWDRICREIETPVGDFRAYVSFVNDRVFEGLTPDELLAVARNSGYRTFLFVVDEEALRSPEHGILVIDLIHEPGRTFRTIPSEMWAVENNLSLANMDFSEFAENTGADHVFRGFPGP